MLDALIAAGTDIFRLNFSHGTHESQRGDVRARPRRGRARAGREVAILQDLGGPKIRTGLLDGGRPITRQARRRAAIATGDFVGGPGRISTTFEGLAQERAAGRSAAARRRPRSSCASTSTDGTEIQTTVVEGGELGEHKGINAPGVPLPASAITPKDVDDLRFGLSLGVDMVALSFVQTRRRPARRRGS